MRTSGWGDGGDCEEGEKGEAQGDACCFLEKERIEEGVKDEKRGGIEIWKMRKESKQKNFFLHVDILSGFHNLKALWRG